ncbi:TetR family transcriptional regulator [Nocardia sp. NPDC005978]|uniref:TetR/AcrR family transcriptional regulator n=1 Tax=Nocardia sp. NPDC005978 TaxID=3156725 RepID=UPI0033BE4689
MSTAVPDRHRTGGKLGRQTEAERNDQLVLAAARAVFAEQGNDAPVSAIAERAGVGMGTLYRRYGSKEQLLQRLCLIAIGDTAEALRAALDLDGSGWKGLFTFLERCVAARVGAFAPLAGSLPIPPEVVAGNARAKELLEQLLAKGQADGSVRTDVNAVDITRLIEMFSGYPQRTEEDVRARQRLLALAADGLRPSGTSIAGPAPTWEAYESQWYR